MRKNLQFFFLYLKIFLGKHHKQLIGSFIAGFIMVLLAFQSYPVYLAIIGKKHKKIGVVGKITERNLPLLIQNQISFGLTSLSSSGEALPALSSAWEADNNGTLYTFYLKDNIYWHDGKKFTAADISYRLKDAAIKAVDEKTITISLKDPFSVLPVLLSQPLIRDNFIGMGQYKVKRTDYNGEYLSLLTLAPLEANLPTLTYKFFNNYNEALLAFKLGEINQLRDLTGISDFEGWDNITIESVDQYDRFVGIFFNLKDPLFKDKEVRQGLAYAVPKINSFEKAYTPVSPLSWAYSSKVRLYNYDPETATKILSKSDLASSSASITLSTYAPLIETAETIASSWTQLGINVKVKVVSVFDPNYQVFLLTQTIPPDPDQYHLWQSTQENTNISFYNNPKIDKLLEEGRKTAEKEKRIKLYADFQRYLVDDLPVIFLYYPKVYQVERR